MRGRVRERESKDSGWWGETEDERRRRVSGRVRERDGGRGRWE